MQSTCYKNKQTKTNIARVQAKFEVLSGRESGHKWIWDTVISARTN